MDFVGADFYGFRVVDNFESKFPRSFRHDIRRVQWVGGSSDEHGVIFWDFRDVFSEEEVEFLSRFLGCQLEVLECGFFSVVGEVVFLHETSDFTH